MPPLTVEFHEEMRHLENQFRRSLGSCLAGYELHDSIGAFDYTRTYAVKFYDQIYSFYSRYPEFQKSWQLACEYYAFQRIAHCLDNYFALRTFFREQDRLNKIINTISDHARSASLPKASIAPVAPVLDSPLLVMTKAATMSHRLIEPPSAGEIRRAYVQPLLDKRGWSVPEWAEKAKVSRHTAQSYLDADRKTYHYNRRKLSDALGVSFDEFPK